MLVWKAHRGKVRSLAFSPDGRRLVSTSGTSTYVWLWDPSKGKIVRKIPTTLWSARVAAFFPDGKHLAAGGENRTVMIWDVETRTVVSSFAIDHVRNDRLFVETLAISPDGSRLVVCSGSTALVEWDEPLRPWAGSPRLPDRTVANTQYAPIRIGFSPTGKYFCVAERRMHLHDPLTLKPVRSLKDPGGQTPQGANATAFAFTPDESRLAVALGMRAAIWRTENFEEKAVQIRGHINLVKTIGFLPNGSLLTAGMDGTARVWDANTGAALRSFDWQIGKVLAAAISPDGMLCAAGSDEGRIVVWDVDG